MFVPLREQCRKFDAYLGQGISESIVPQLMLPEVKNRQVLARTNTTQQLVAMMLANDRNATRCTAWTMRNHFHVPMLWVEKMLAVNGFHVNATLKEQVRQERLFRRTDCTGSFHG